MEHSGLFEAFLGGLPADRRQGINVALRKAFGGERVARIEPGPRGASGAALFRLELDEGTASAYLLRVEGPRTPMRNPHQYICMQRAAAAGIAPAIRHIDEDAGVAVMAWIPHRPLESFPGGAPALARALGGLVHRLQQTEPFPELREYGAILERLLAVMRAKCMPGLLDRHADGFAALRTAYPWDTARVSSHNDLNPHNVLFDGDRLWLVDWETSFRNDAMVDVATTAEHFAATPELEVALLEAWGGGPADARTQARLRVMRVLTRLYYAGLLLMIGTARSPDLIADLSAPDEAEFRARLASGTLAAYGPEMMTTLAKMQLGRFLAGIDDPEVAAAIRTLGNG